ncbi:MAG: NUDIX domain-containing protein [Herpetosiphon sp.]
MTMNRVAEPFDQLGVTVELVIFTLIDEQLEVLLQRKDPEHVSDQWFLPGGFVRHAELLETAAKRELEDGTGLSQVYLEQLYTFNSHSADPRGRLITVAYIALVRADHALSLASTSTTVRWFPVNKLPPLLAFYHRPILEFALQRLQSKFEYTTLAFQLLPEEFTLAELYEMYGQIFGGQRRSGNGAQHREWQGLDKRNFYRKIIDTGILRDTGRFREGRGRPPKLYTFEPEKAEGEFVFRWREARSGS